MDPDKQEAFMALDETAVQDRDPNLSSAFDLVQDSAPDEDQDPDPDSDSAPELEQDSAPDSEQDSEAEEDVRIFNAWMRRCRGETSPSAEEDGPEKEVTERPGSRSRTESRAGSRMSLDPPVAHVRRRASLPCPSTLSSMTLSRLHVSTATPVTAKILLRGSSSRRLLPSPQEVPPPPSGERERRGSLALPNAPPTIPETPSLQLGLDLIPDKPSIPKKHFRRRNVMSLSDADSICLICHNDLKHGAGTRHLQCSHTFHKECIEEHLWQRQACPTCLQQVALPQTLQWTSTLKGP